MKYYNICNGCAQHPDNSNGDGDCGDCAIRRLEAELDAAQKKLGESANLHLECAKAYMKIHGLETELEAAKAEYAHLKSVSALYREPEQSTITRLRAELEAARKEISSMKILLDRDADCRTTILQNQIDELTKENEEKTVLLNEYRDKIGWPLEHKEAEKAREQ